MSKIIETIRHAITRRPARVAEAALALAGTLGFALTDTAEAQVVAVVTALVGLIGAEVAQRKTTPTADPKGVDVAKVAEQIDVDTDAVEVERILADVLGYPPDDAEVGQ